MLDYDQEIDTHQRRHLLLKKRLHCPVTAGAGQPGGNGEWNAAKKTIDRWEMQNVHIRCGDRQLAKRVDILPKRCVRTQEIDRWNRKDYCRPFPKECKH